MKSLYVWLAACALAFLAACAAPENAEKGSYSGHAAFIERAKAGW